METREDLPQSDHLIMLVGSNPLPNAVAGSLLVTRAEESNITLLHSDGSEDVAENLRNWFRRPVSAKRFPGTTCLKEVDESDPVSIAKAVKEALDRVRAKSVGLHYTGGTKTMGVHSYRTVEHVIKNWAQREGVQTDFSYLNARTLEMIFDPAAPWSGGRTKRVKVGNAVNISLKDLVDLHGWDGIGEPSDRPVLPLTAGALATFHHSEPDWGAWRRWKTRKLYPQCKDNGTWNGRWKSPEDLDILTLSLPAEANLTNVTNTIRSELGQLAGDICLHGAATTCHYQETECFCGWLDGKWLESAVLDALQKLSAKLELHDVLMNVEPRTGRTGFELDVVAIRGYQLFAFSCSTEAADGEGRRARLKRKLFEAVMRARQMGGDEACVALVCCSDDPEGLQAETRNSFQDAAGDERIKVFGRGDLADLQDRIKNWIKKQSHA